MLFFSNSAYVVRLLTKERRKWICNIQGVSGGIVNILGGGSMDYSD